MVDKLWLDNYCDMVSYIDDLERKEDKLRREIDKLAQRVAEIEGGEKVVDVVKGGEGGIQTFKIEGIPTTELSKKKTTMLMKRLKYDDIQNTIAAQKVEMIEKLSLVEEFIAGIEDVHTRRIFNLRFVENLTWNQVADAMGGGNTDEAVKKVFQRYMAKMENRPTCTEK